MNVAIELPEAIARELEAKWGDLSTKAREALAVEAYRSGVLSGAQVQELLGLATRWELDALLKRTSVYLDYTEADLDRDLANSRRLQGK
jgi:predicted HTH domain antitoxin